MREFLRRRPWVADAALAASYFFIASILAVASALPPLETPVWFTVALLAAGLGVIALRRSRPVWSFTGALVLFALSLAGGTGAEAVLVVVALYTVGGYRSGRAVWACFGLAALTGAYAAWILTSRARTGAPLWEPTQPPVTVDPFADWVNAVLLIVVPFLIATLFGANAGQRRRYVAALIDRAGQLARERDQQAEIAAARERERIAGEMHDVIAHSLSVIVALSEGAYAAAPLHPDQSRDAIARVAETGRRTLGEVRRLLGTVRGDGDTSSADSTPQPDASHLPALVEEFRAAGLPVRMSVSGRAHADPALGLTVYRIVQESLTNALRHAKNVDDVSVVVEWAPGGVTLLVEDAASAPVTSQGAGRGLIGIRQRAALYDGSVEVGARPGGGWRVFVRLSWKEDHRG